MRYPRVSQKRQFLPNWKIQLSLGIFELFGSKAFTKIFFENFRAGLALPLSRRSFRDLLIKPKKKVFKSLQKWILEDYIMYKDSKNVKIIKIFQQEVGQTAFKLGYKCLISGVWLNTLNSLLWRPVDPLPVRIFW